MLTYIRLLPSVVLLLTIPATAQTVLYVDAKAPSGGDGSSWASAYRSLQDALTAAAPDSGVAEIRVAAGTYKPDQGTGFTPGDRDATFTLINGVAIRGGYAGMGTPDPDHRDLKANETILSGDLLGNDGPGFVNDSENSMTVVTAKGVNESAVLEGLTVTGGNGHLAYGAGGIAIRGSSSPVLVDLTVRRNRSPRHAGGIECNSCSTATARPIIVNCLIAENSAADGGGAFAVATASPVFINCLFLANTATNEGGGFRAYNGKPSFTNCAFIGNRAAVGGAIAVEANSTLTLTTVSNCTLVHNQASLQGGGIHLRDSARASVLNSILWNNIATGTLESNQIFVEGGQVGVGYSCIQGWTGLLGGMNNDGADPLFANLDGPDGVPGTWDDNLRLQLASPCVDTGNADLLPADVGDLDGDGDRTEPIPLDLDGAPRVIGGIVNRGAYENTDCNANGIGDVADIAAGTSSDCNNDLIPDECQPEVCPCGAPGDMDCDGDVDQSDFGAFQVCLTGSTIPQLHPACRAAHLDSDEDVDITDLFLFQKCISGPDMPAERNCTE